MIKANIELLKRLLSYIAVYLLFTGIIYGAFYIIAIIGCGLNNCYSCCLDRFTNEILLHIDGFFMVNWYALPGISFFVIADSIDRYIKRRKKYPIEDCSMVRRKK